MTFTGPLLIFILVALHPYLNKYLRIDESSLLNAPVFEHD